MSESLECELPPLPPEIATLICAHEDRALRLGFDRGLERMAHPGTATRPDFEPNRKARHALELAIRRAIKKRVSLEASMGEVSQRLEAIISAAILMGTAREGADIEQARCLDGLRRDFLVLLSGSPAVGDSQETRVECAHSWGEEAGGGVRCLKCGEFLPVWTTRDDMGDSPTKESGI